MNRVGELLCGHPTLRVTDYDDEACRWVVRCGDCGLVERWRHGELSGRRARPSSRTLRPLITVAPEQGESGRAPRG